jgi:hypothetical protein
MTMKRVWIIGLSVGLILYIAVDLVSAALLWWLI